LSERQESGMAQHHKNPAWTWLAPVAATVVLGLKATGLLADDAPATFVLAAVALGANVFAAVHHAEILAIKLGEPFGSILLAVAVTVIEVGLIVSIMLSGAENAGEVARDTVFAALMIVLNGVVGFCLLVGGQRHHEQTFQLQGATSALAVLGTLATITLILPNFTLSARGPSFSTIQVVVIGAVSLVLWAAFVFAQTIRHRAYFLDDDAADIAAQPGAKPGDRVAAASLGLLVVALASVVFLAKALSAPLGQAIEDAGLPPGFVGVVIAAVVLLPEGIAAAKSAKNNKLQNSLNLAIGSAVASIGLTVPVVAGVSVAMGTTLSLGVSASGMVLVLLTLFASTLTLGTGRTTILQGIIHLTIFAVFLLIAMVP